MTGRSMVIKERLVHCTCILDIWLKYTYRILSAKQCFLKRILVVARLLEPVMAHVRFKQPSSNWDVKGGPTSCCLTLHHAGLLQLLNVCLDHHEVSHQHRWELQVLVVLASQIFLHDNTDTN